MTRRTLWLALVVLVSQVSAGCCCLRQCVGWRLRQCGTHVPAYSSPVSVGPVAGGPSCLSCDTPPVVGGPIVSYAGPVGPVLGPSGPLPLHSPTPVPGPVVSSPAPLGSGPSVGESREGVPSPMPPLKPAH